MTALAARRETLSLPRFQSAWAIVLAGVQLAARLLLLAALLLMLGERLVAIGPTIGADPDPEGYVSYARGLADTGRLQWHGRPPGYPAIMIVVDRLLPFSLPWDMYYFHLAVTVVFGLATTLLVWRVVGFAVAALYLAILGLNSHFARNAIVMFADLPHTVLLYLAALAAGLFLLRAGWVRHLALVAFCLVSVAAFAVHPSGDMRVQLFVWAGIAVVLLGGLVRHGWRGVRARGGLLAALLVLSGATFLAGQVTQRALQLPDRLERLGGVPGASFPFPSSRAFLQDWVAYRMLLCLPMPPSPTPLDLRIEEVKGRIAARQGYPTPAVVPPGHAPEFLALARAEAIPPSVWHPRLAAHPFALVGCALREMRAKWHYLVRNLTPFTTFEADKTFLTPEYPPDSGSWRDRIFWTTGLSLFRLVAADETDARVRAALIFELWRVGLVLAWIVVGLVLIDRRWPRLGLVFALASTGWFALLSFGVPVETRYFMANMPVIYLAQAMAVVALARLPLTAVRAARARFAPRDVPDA